MIVLAVIAHYKHTDTFTHTVKVGCSQTPMLLCYLNTHACYGVVGTPLGVCTALIQF